MTRFARYSTKGIKKPPLDATPWSELAPPSAAKHATPSKAASEEPLGTPTANGKKFKEKKSGQMDHHLTASTGKKKGKKNALKRLSLPQESTDDHSFDLDLDESMEVEPSKMNGKEMKSGSKTVQGESIQSLKKKKKQLVKAAQSATVDQEEEAVSAASPQSMKKKKKQLAKGVSSSMTVDQEDDDISAAAGLQEESDSAKSAQKGKKRKMKDADTPKKKKKQSDQHEGDSSAEKPSEPAAAEPAPKSNGHNLNPPGKKNKKNKNQKSQQQVQQQGQQKSTHAAATAGSGPPLLAESPLMTQFEGYWVRRRAVPRLEKIREELAATITDPQKLRREMKKRKRAEHSLLLSKLAARGAKKPTSAAARLQGTPGDSDGEGDDHDDGDGNAGDLGSGGEGVEDADSAEEDVDMPKPAFGGRDVAAPERRRTVMDDRNPSGAPREERMVKFDGVWMTADAVGRLKELRRTLKQQRVSELVIKQTMKTARRREEMKRKREAKRVCLGCRRPGHMVSECPEKATSNTKAVVTGLCFRCGSTEHRLAECRKPADATGKLPYAVCFVCGQTGHLSRDCSLNPNGVYPKGGACKVCKQRDHLADDCPERKEEETAATGPRLATIGDGPLEQDYQHDFKEMPTEAAKAAQDVRKPRKVKF